MESIELTATESPGPQVAADLLRKAAEVNPHRVRYRDEQARQRVESLGRVWLPPYAAPTAELVKSNARRMVYRVVTPAGDYAVKTHYRDGSDRLLDSLRGTPALRELAAARHARESGVAAIDILAAAEIPPNPHGIALSISLATWNDNRGSLDHCWREEPSLQPALINAAATLLASAHAASLLVPDCHPGNLIVDGDDAGPLRCAYVDLGGARWQQPLTPAQMAADLAALHQWFARHATVRQRMRFLRTYLALAPRPLSRVQRRTQVTAIERAINRHAFSQYRKRDRRIPGWSGRKRTSRFFLVAGDDFGWQAIVTRRLRDLPHQLPLSLPIDRQQTSAALDPDTLFGGSPSADASALRRQSGVIEWSAASRLAALGWRLWGSPAERQYRSACLALNRDVPALGNLACTVQRRGGLTWHAVLYQPQPAGQVALAEACAGTRFRERREQLRAAAQLLARSARTGLVVRHRGESPIAFCPVAEEGAGAGHWVAYWTAVECQAQRGPLSDTVLVWMLSTLAQTIPANSLSRSERASLLRQLGRCRGRTDWRQLWRMIASQSHPGRRVPTGPSESIAPV